MFEFIQIIPIAGTSIFMLAVGTLWYSESLFGPRWRESISVSLGQQEKLQKHMIVYTVITGLQYFIVLALVFAAMLFLRKSHLDAYLSPLAFWLAITLPLITSVIWEGRKLSYLFITSGFYAILLGGGSLMMWYWPW